jgi:quercetin dioxygenase-like cupin family protein
MKIVHYSDVPAAPVTAAGSVGVQIRWLIAKDDGAPHFAMRHFEIEPGGQTPQHHHPWEHEVYVLEGEGVVSISGKETTIGPGMAVFIPEHEPHCFMNKTNKPFRFLCVIPIES